MKSLESLRRERGYSQRELAEIAGVSPATVYGIEAGKRPQPRGSTLRKLAKALEVGVPDLLEEEAPKAPAPPSLEAASAGLSDERRSERTPEEIFEALEQFTEYARKLTVGTENLAGVPYQTPMLAAITARNLFEEEAEDLREEELSTLGRRRLAAMRDTIDEMRAEALRVLDEGEALEHRQDEGNLDNVRYMDTRVRGVGA